MHGLRPLVIFAALAVIGFGFLFAVDSKIFLEIGNPPDIEIKSGEKAGIGEWISLIGGIVGLLGGILAMVNTILEMRKRRSDTGG